MRLLLILISFVKSSENYVITRSENTTPTPPPCEQIIRFNAIGQSFTIKSPGYPFSYGVDHRCYYLATSPPGTRMTLDCEEFNLEASSNYTCDHALFFLSLDGNLTSPNGGKFGCGKGSFRQHSISNKLTIFFGTKNGPNLRSIYPFRFSCSIKVIGEAKVRETIPAIPKLRRPLSKSSTKCSCGEQKLKRESRIIGGEETVLSEFPWRCSLFNGSTDCGCAVISQQWVITAAHCVISLVGSYYDNLKVNVGDYDLSTSGEVPNELVPVSKIILHPAYNSTTFDNDLSLLKLKKNLVFGDNVQPVCLPFKFVGKSLQGMDTIGTGWGLDDYYEGKQNSILQKVSLRILETEECRRFANYSKELLTDNMFCTYGDGRRDMCQGDSGGGINIYDNETRRYFEVGICSWGMGCGHEKNPGVAVKLTLKKYLEWVRAITGPELCIVE